MNGTFSIATQDHGTQARAGTLTTSHGLIETPIFMPVGTVGSVKGIHQHELRDDIEAQIILGNTYHLYLRPGLDVLQAAGGLHPFMGWEKPMLTDSGGYQVYSLSHRSKMTEDGVTFQSHIDGSRHFFSPEKAIDIQRVIGADIIMAFDECTPFPCDYQYAKESMHRTHRWLDRCLAHAKQQSFLHGHEQLLAPIVQGSTYTDLRKQSAQYIAEKDMAINAIGGLSVGEPEDELYAMTDLVCSVLPSDKPRYLMGVGTPANLLECIALGIDMFDCVLPTRNARHGLLYTQEGIINIKNAKWKSDFSAIDERSTMATSRNHSKAYLRHLMHAKEKLGAQIASLHNLGFYLWLVKEARKQIQLGQFGPWKASLINALRRRL